MENAGLLARVSDPKQEDNTSLQDQLNRGRSYCALKGYNVVVEKCEVMSGVFVLARSAYNELLDMASEGKLSVIVVDITDRLGRGDAIAKLELLAELNGARVEYATPGRDTSTIEGMAMKATDQLVSGIERLNIRRRTMSGKRTLAKQGRVIRTHLRPYGYEFASQYDDRGRKVTCELVVIEEEARVVRMMFDWCVYEHLSTYGISKRLTEMAIPRMRPNVKRSRHAWSNKTVRDILTNTTYRGEWRYAKNEVKAIDTPNGIKTKRIARSQEDTVAVKVPAIVSDDVWWMAQRQLNENHKKFTRPTKYRYLLRGRIRCARCNGLYTGKTNKRRRTSPYSYYVCIKVTPAYRLTRCMSSAIPAHVIESAVWEVICDQLQDEMKLTQRLRDRHEESGKARRSLEQMIAATEAQIQKVQGKFARFTDLYGEGNMNKDEYLAQKRKADGEIHRLAEEKSQWELRLGDYPEVSTEFEDELRRLRKAMLDRLTPDTPPEAKAEIIEMLDIRCVYDDQRREITITGLIDKRTVSVISMCVRSAMNTPLSTCVMRLTS